MRVIVFFDLPITTGKNKSDYRKFRKHLIESGFIMQQESVYSKLARNSVAADAIIQSLKKVRPPEGVVQVLKITEKQYAAMETIVGERKRDVLETDESLVVL